VPLVFAVHDGYDGLLKPFPEVDSDAGLEAVPKTLTEAVLEAVPEVNLEVVRETVPEDITKPIPGVVVHVMHLSAPRRPVCSVYRGCR